MGENIDEIINLQQFMNNINFKTCTEFYLAEQDQIEKTPDLIENRISELGPGGPGGPRSFNLQIFWGAQGKKAQK